MKRKHEHRTNLKTLKAAVKMIWPEMDGMIKRRLVLTLLMILLTSGLVALSPVIFSMIIDGFNSGHWKSIDFRFFFNLFQSDNQRSPQDTIFVVGPIVLVIAYAANQWLNRTIGEVQSLVFGTADTRLNRRISGKLFAHIMQLPLRYHLDRKSGALNQTLVQGLSGYQMLLQIAVLTILPVLTQLLIVGSILFYLNPVFLVILAFSAIAYTFTFARGAAKISEPSRDLSAKQIESHGVMTDSLLNYETVKYFTGEKFVENRYDSTLQKAENKWVLFYRRKMTNGFALAVIFALSIGTANWVATQQVMQGALTVGTLIIVNAYMMQIIGPLEQLGSAFTNIAQGVSFMEKMLGIFNQKPEAIHIENHLKTKAKPVDRQLAHTAQLTNHQAINWCDAMDDILDTNAGKTLVELNFNRVNFSYQNNRAILRNINFTVASGKTTAIVGPSGSGKSSLVRLLVRFYETDNGNICLNSIPISDIPLNQLRQTIAVVPQDTVLFNDTLAYNIGFGKPGCSQEEIEQAAHLAHIDRFIDSLPDKYQTIVGERGLKLSGGEKQRIAIARAVLKKPQVFVFDEATSSLDTHTEQEIQNNLMEISRGTTTLIVAHRLSTVVHADEILVMDKGQIVERGSHQELLQKNSVYASMWRTQQKLQVKTVV